MEAALTNSDKEISLKFERFEEETLFGKSFGAEIPDDGLSGEVVFNTGMVGYPEALTDPSYKGQILVLTYPLIGNYGIPGEEVMDTSTSPPLPLYFESKQIQIKGLIVAQYTEEYSHWAAVRSLGDYLKSQGVPAMYGVDTRHVTKLIREYGSLLGRFENVAVDTTVPRPSSSFVDPNTENLVAQVSTPEVVVYKPTKTAAVAKIIAFDCGIKYNIIRYLVSVYSMEVVLLPYDFPLEEVENSGKEWEGSHFQGVFLSNGPGNPEMCSATIASIKYLLNSEKHSETPIFGICLGNQLLGLAAGGSTYKLKYGNRGMNQPAIDLRDGRCYITPQNHGYALDSNSLPSNWKPLFVNGNDMSNEGIICIDKPHFSCQFHPEAAGGPDDTAFLFGMFRDKILKRASDMVLINELDYLEANKTYRKVLLVGSGGLSIGQAGEFDYSGSQCIKGLKEENIEVVLINPNIATVQTSPSASSGADRVYFLPILANTVKDVILREKPDGIIVSMGGQTALNVGCQLWNDGFLQEHNVKILGTQIPVIEATEDREIFSQKLAEIGETIALSYPATTVEEAKEAANKIGYPVLIRAAFALGGLGSGFAHDEDELVELAKKAFATSDQILIDQDLRGWKELEYEVVRDSRDNCITVCNMENFDPLGVHTGDSIVVAPSQTLTNREYMMLRRTAIKVVRHLGIVGECNIQYALNPKTEQYCIIEVNARLSRSSALASKATGYPLAYVATKLSLGKDLVSIKNSVTKTTTACFEPSLDYCVLKMPRWDLKKFQRVSNKLGSSMLSVGEVMAIGRNFEEVIQKACRMVNPGLDGLEGEDSGLVKDLEIPLDEQLRVPTDTRLFSVQSAFEQGYSVERVHELTKIDNWFLSKLYKIAQIRKSAKTFNNNGGIEALANSGEALRIMKEAGFSDRQIARYVGATELDVRGHRISRGVVPCVKQIDTLAAEFPAMTNYLYMTYIGKEDDVVGFEESEDDDVRPRSMTLTSEFDVGSKANTKTTDLKKKGVMVLGCGAYCIGSSVEFDWCAVSCVRELRKDGYKAIVVNYNPETVSTDYDESDRLYFEELSLERVMDIYQRESAGGIVVSVGGQIPNNLAHPLHTAGANILGTHPYDIDRCEDRSSFSKMLDELGIMQPQWSVLKSKDEAIAFAEKVSYPVLVRPSFVLSGAAMRVAADETQLRNFLDLAADVSGDKPVVVTKFILNAKEIEFDAVAENGKILNYAIGEHLENAGVHSGDATVILPAQKLYVNTIREVKRYASLIAKALRITGPFNIQFMAKGNHVQVIECNLRASRTFPFVSKTMSANFISLATRAMCGAPAKPYRISLLDIEYVCVKAPMFSFTRLRGADPTLGVEMASTGEVACFGFTEEEAFMQAMLSAGFKIPNRTKNILISIASESFRNEFLEAAKTLSGLGYNLFATAGTAKYYQEHGLEISVAEKPNADKSVPSNGKLQAVAEMSEGRVDLLINISEGSTVKDEITSGYLMRRTAVDFGVSLITDIKCASKFAECMKLGSDIFSAKHIGDFYKIPTIGWTRE